MEITQKNIKELKSQIKIDKPLGKLLQDSLVVGSEMKGMRLTAATGASGEYQSFNFDIKLLKVSGRIYKSGQLDVTGSVFGIKIAHTTVDLSNSEVCWNPQIGKLLSVKYCFYMKGKCLYTRGQVRGWFPGRKGWNQRILCF